IANIQRRRRKRRLADVALQPDERAHTASARELTIERGATSSGGGTIADRSRAIATTSLTIATAVASPPAPAPKMPTLPEWTPVTIAAFCGPTARPKIEVRGTATGATQADSARRS